jgi:sugar O-acyltransferase (sialic acid O-acetyltransferase NeuD family)
LTLAHHCEIRRFSLKNIVLIGGGGFSSEVAEVAVQNGFEVVGYVDIAQTGSDLKYLGKVEDYFSSNVKSEFVFPAYGAVDQKGLLRRSTKLMEMTDANIPVLVSSHAYVSSSVILGRGAFISHGVVINPNTHIGDFSIINSGTTIGHNVILSNFSIISGNVFVGGGCKIGKNTLVGPGVTIMQSVDIGSEVIVSVGSTVGRDIPDGKTTLPSLAKYV